MFLQKLFGNPVMPLVAFGAVFVIVGSVLMFYVNAVAIWEEVALYFSRFVS